MAERPAVDASPLIQLAAAQLLDFLQLAGPELVGGTTVPGIRIEAEWLGDHAEEGVDQANDLSPKLVGHESKEDAGPRRTRSVDPPEFAVEHAQRFRHGRFAAEPPNRLRDLRESSFVVLEDVEEIVRVLVGPRPANAKAFRMT